MLIARQNTTLVLIDWMKANPVYQPGCPHCSALFQQLHQPC